MWGVGWKDGAAGESWVARWQRLDNLKPGVYAMEVTGELPDFAQRYVDENKAVAHDSIGAMQARSAPICPDLPRFP